jgi:opacity protein-like surface antigen
MPRPNPLIQEAHVSNTTVRRIAPLFATVSLGLVMLANSGRAQDGYDQPLQGNIGVHAGYAKTQSAEAGNALGGLHLEFMPLRVFGIQGAVDYRSDEEFDINQMGNAAELNVRTIPVTLSGKLYAPIAPRFQPYGLAGAGWYHQIFDFSENLEMLGIGDRDETTFGWHLGLGAAALMGPRFGAFAEARWVFLDPDRQLDDATVEQLEEFDFDTGHFMAGLNFFF